MDLKLYFLSCVIFIFFTFSLLYGVQYGFCKEKQIDFELDSTNYGFINSAAFCSFFFFIFEVLCSSLNTELYSNMQYKINKQSEFKFILDHLEENIVIFNNLKKIDFINHKFIQSFTKHIQDIELIKLDNEYYNQKNNYPDRK